MWRISLIFASTVRDKLQYDNSKKKTQENFVEENNKKKFGRTAELLPDDATCVLSAILDEDQFESCGIKGAADVKELDVVLVIKDAENNILSKKNISVSY